MSKVGLHVCKEQWLSKDKKMTEKYTITQYKKYTICLSYTSKLHGVIIILFIIKKTKKTIWS